MIPKASAEGSGTQRHNIGTDGWRVQLSGRRWERFNEEARGDLENDGGKLPHLPTGGAINTLKCWPEARLSQGPWARRAGEEGSVHGVTQRGSEERAREEAALMGEVIQWAMRFESWHPSSLPLGGWENPAASVGAASLPDTPWLVLSQKISLQSPLTIQEDGPLHRQLAGNKGGGLSPLLGPHWAHCI